MATLPVHVSTLPPFSNMHARCPRCGGRREIRVHFDRDCTEVTGGDHFHRICPCGHRWVERTSEGPLRAGARVNGASSVVYWGAAVILRFD
jgi:hypothetical protein